MAAAAGWRPWLAPGQSNMAFLLENAFNGSALVQDANNHPHLRMMTTRKTTAAAPLRDLLGPLPLPWAVSSNVSVSDDGKSLRASSGAADDNWLYMSAVCYLFGLNIHKARGYPVGLINSNWGGTMIQDWSSAEAMAACSSSSGSSSSSDNNDHADDLQSAAAVTTASEPPSSDGNNGIGALAPVGAGSGASTGVATHLFNAMIAPLLNTTIAGAVWCECDTCFPESVFRVILFQTAATHTHRERVCVYAQVCRV